MKISVSTTMLAAVLPFLLPAPPACAQYGVALARYNPNGSLDTTFDDDGKVLTTFGDGQASASALAVDTNGRAVVAGHFYRSYDSRHWMLARYLPDGRLDATFGRNGAIVTRFNELWSEQATDIALDSSGRIVAAGWGEGFDSPSRAEERMALARYNEDGTLDLTFSEDGKRSLSFPDHPRATAHAVGIDASGRIVVAGRAASNPALARFTEGGQLDSSFDDDGRVVTELDPRLTVYDMVIAPDGKIVVAGSAIVDSGFQFALARYNPDGSLDPTFGLDGRVFTDFAGSSAEWAQGIAIDPAGKIVAAGQAEVRFTEWQFALARYNSDGSLDPTFDADGTVLIDFATSSAEDASSVAIDADGRIVAVGNAYLGPGGFPFALARLNTDGSLDSSFDGDGQVLTDFGGFARTSDVAIDADGKITAAGIAADWGALQAPDF